MSRLREKKFLGIAAACLLVASLVVAGAVAPATTPLLAEYGPSVSIEPDTQEVAAGGTCSVDVLVDSAGTPITACNVVVTFDADLTATGVTGADLLGTFGVDALYLPTIEVGEVSYGGARIDGPVAVSGNLVTIDFDVDAAAVGTYDLVVDATLKDADGDPIAVVENDGEVVIGVPGPEEFFKEFDGTLAQGERDFICTIPGGATELEITLTTEEASPGPDMDLELYDGDTLVIGYTGEIGSSGATVGTYEGDEFGYSGYKGGEEYISAGAVSQPYDLKVYAFRAGTYTVTVSYVMPGPDITPPDIDIELTIAALNVGYPITVTVSATDPSGVAMVYFMVSVEEWPEGWPDSSSSLAAPQHDYEDMLQFVMSFSDEASVTFTPGWAGTYTVEAWAVDKADNYNEEPVTATFEVSE